ncbi:MAG: ribonuclease III [Verrucomicrobia subdivision 3 bacterium]|nr:ribonuclease III [Limisphaerales bacterium]
MAGQGSFQKRLGYTFKDPALLELALRHPSVSHEKSEPLQNNQRLEFLGDAVLQLVISAELFRQFPARDEGTLSKARARLVNKEALAEQALSVEIGPELMVSRGEEKSGGRERPSALADAFEAVVGAIYLDGGFTKVEKFIHTQFAEAFKGADAGRHVGNPKGELQEILQSKNAVAPEYRLLDSQGPDHDRFFECSVRHCGNELARGTGKSKKAAETDAATNAIAAFQETQK